MVGALAAVSAIAVAAMLVARGILPALIQDFRMVFPGADQLIALQVILIPCASFPDCTSRKMKADDGNVGAVGKISAFAALVIGGIVIDLLRK